MSNTIFIKRIHREPIGNPRIQAVNIESRLATDFKGGKHRIRCHTITHDHTFGTCPTFPLHRHMPPVGLLAEQAVPNSSDDDARAALAYFSKKGQTAKTPTEARTDNTEAAKLRHL